jgi:hypothetical protein
MWELGPCLLTTHDGKHVEGEFDEDTVYRDGEKQASERVRLGVKPSRYRLEESFRK